VLGRMVEALRHRGPDDAGQWFDAAAGVGLGFSRLSILDLSQEGRQPMVSASGRYVIVYNGEIYNFAQLGAEEAAHGTRFRGHSDTEILLAVIERHGVAEATRRCAGMFAYALWDRTSRVLYLVRDRFGEKPLYHGRFAGTLVFASEIRGIREHPAFDSALDLTSLGQLLTYGCVPVPRSIYTGLAKLEPGTIASYREDGHFSTLRYWRPREAAAVARRNRFHGSPAEAVGLVGRQLAETVALERVADVPVGAFLSGGVDSSLIVATMCARGSAGVRTFSIGFADSTFDEAPQARAVASHLGTDHTELLVTGPDAQAVVPDLGTMYDEPFADASQIPTYLVARLARQHVTVALSGDGGDELFGGYNRYRFARSYWPCVGRLPVRLRRAVARAGLRGSPRLWNGLFRLYAAPGGAAAEWQNPTDRLLKLLAVLDAENGEALYRRLLAPADSPAQLVLGLTARLPDPPALQGGLPDCDLVSAMMLLDAELYLPDDILVKVDRATMAVSLESRAPFLDHRLAEVVWQLDPGLHFKDGRGKWILRELLGASLPPELIARLKKGFEVPLAAWLRGALLEWAADLLEPGRLRRQGLFDPDAVTALWQTHLRGERNAQALLWPLLMFQTWYDAAATPATVSP
jgi:asparagine synthase (glutamine-hydrolysing)